MPEKLLTLGETSQLLGISEDEIKKLVDKGELPAYKIGGEFLRFRKEQIEAIKGELERRPQQVNSAQKVLQAVKVSANTYDESVTDRVRDFFYFKDFYIVCAVITAFLLWAIFKW